MRLILTLALALFPTVALAHTGAGETSGLAHGFWHPIGGLDHVLAMVAVGVLAALVGGRALWLLPLSFIAMMAVGFLIGVQGIAVPFVEAGIALSVIVIGAAAALGRPIPVAAGMGLVGLFAAFHGVAHGNEMPAASGTLAYVMGFAAATALLHGAGIVLTLATTGLVGRFGRPLAQGAGALIAIGGVGILAGWL